MLAAQAQAPRSWEPERKADAPHETHVADAPRGFEHCWMWHCQAVKRTEGHSFARFSHEASQAPM